MRVYVASQWITANAGSGKTTALTRRVVKLLLLGVAPEHIVCITYTKAAASEMRVRILEMLRQLLLAEDQKCSEMIATLLDAENLDFVASISQLALARNLFGRVLDSPSGGLQLTTIHGFCQNILRRFPMEAGIAPHFTVLDDVAADEALRKAKNALLSGLESTDQWLADAISHIAGRAGEHGFDTLAINIIHNRRMWDETWRGQSLPSLRAHFFALHGLEETLTNLALDDWFCASISADKTAVLRMHLPALLAHKTKSYQIFGKALAAWIEAENPMTKPAISVFVSLFITADGERRKRLLNEKEYPLSHPLRDVVENIAQHAERYVQQSAALACAEDSFAVAVVANALLGLYAQAKIGMHALDYDDLITHTLRLVQHPQTLGWVMSKLDHRIDHLLIDEAQDNSGAMWQLAQIFVEELIASNDGVGHANLPRSVLVVGDEKQSIYSFQGAAPEQFQHYQKAFFTMLDGSPSPLVKSTLNNSYRSAKAVLDFVDAVCLQPSIAQAIQASGISQPHQLKRTNASGRVALYAPIVAPEKQARAEMLIPIEYTHATSAPQQLAEHIATLIHQWLMVENRVLESEQRPLTAGDILILVKNRAPLVQPLIRALQRRAVPVAGIDRLTLAQHLAVRDLLALIAWCMNPSDDLALAQVLRSPLMGWSDEQLRAAAIGRTDSLWLQVESPWLAQVLTWREATPYVFLTQILEASEKRREFARRFGEEIHEVLDEFKAQAATMPASFSPTIAQFYDWMSRSAREIKREQEAAGTNMVRIMTVHGAKGLEAPVVILADTVNVPTTARERVFKLHSAHGQLLPVLAMSPLAKHATRLVEAKEKKHTELLAEYARLFYVAITRPRDELHIFGTATKVGDIKEGSWYETAATALKTLGAVERDGIVQWCDAPSIAAIEATPLMQVVDSPALPIWATCAPDTPVQALILAPSVSLDTPVNKSPYMANAGGDAKSRGIRIHRVLELLHAETTEDIIEQLVRYVAPDWSTLQCMEAVAEITALHRKERWLWEHLRMPEVSVAGTLKLADGQKAAISAQIDLLIQTPTEILIIDYKTGAKIPESAADVPMSYLRQLKIYQALVRQIYPDLPVRCGILWTYTAQLMWLDEAVEAIALVETKHRLLLDGVTS